MSAASRHNRRRPATSHDGSIAPCKRQVSGSNPLTGSVDLQVRDIFSYVWWIPNRVRGTSDPFHERDISAPDGRYTEGSFRIGGRSDRPGRSEMTAADRLHPVSATGPRGGPGASPTRLSVAPCRQGAAAGRCIEVTPCDSPGLEPCSRSRYAAIPSGIGISSVPFRKGCSGHVRGVRAAWAGQDTASASAVRRRGDSSMSWRWRSSRCAWTRAR